uniref:Uncharacterized protein n=1 Tax=Amphimedon queenslandica TaxID=400682 RepID=A0A1X7V8H1_AMPQE
MITNLRNWLKRKENVYTSPEIQNEIIEVMYDSTGTTRYNRRPSDFVFNSYG